MKMRLYKYLIYCIFLCVPIFEGFSNDLLQKRWINLNPLDCESIIILDLREDESYFLSREEKIKIRWELKSNKSLIITTEEGEIWKLKYKIKNDFLQLQMAEQSITMANIDCITNIDKSYSFLMGDLTESCWVDRTRFRVDSYFDFMDNGLGNFSYENDSDVLNQRIRWRLEEFSDFYYLNIRMVMEYKILLVEWNESFIKGMMVNSGKLESVILEKEIWDIPKKYEKERLLVGDWELQNYKPSVIYSRAPLSISIRFENESFHYVLKHVYNNEESSENGFLKLSKNTMVLLLEKTPAQEPLWFEIIELTRNKLSLSISGDSYIYRRVEN